MSQSTLEQATPNVVDVLNELRAERMYLKAAQELLKEYEGKIRRLEEREATARTLVEEARAKLHLAFGPPDE